MKLRHLRLPLAVLLALGVATGAAAQNKQKKSERAAPTALPILNNANGKVEAVLLLEPTGEASAAHAGASAAIR